MKKIIFTEVSHSVINIKDVDSSNIVVLFSEGKPDAILRQCSETNKYFFACFDIMDSSQCGYADTIKDICKIALKNNSHREFRVYDSIEEMMLDCAAAYN